MKPSLGRISAALAESTEQYPAELIALINHNVHPPVPVTAADVHIRAMYVVSDAVNSYGGAFPADEHARLARMLIDSPVMIGHRKDKLPVGRTFHTACVTYQGRPWVKAYFYWLRNSEHGEELKENIDGGVFKECSISFTFNLPECSVCGRDIRTCEHEPMQQYRLHGQSTTCHFNYRRIDRVLETSLVYRGAVPGTSISRELVAADTTAGFSHGRELVALDQLAPDQEYVIIPRYQGIPVTLANHDGKAVLVKGDGSVLDPGLPSIVREQDLHNEPATGLLVAYRGSCRCSLTELEHHLSGGPADVTSLTLHMLPNQRMAGLEGSNDPDLRVRTIPSRVAKSQTLKSAAAEITTALGVELYPLGELPTSANCWRCHPDHLKDAPSVLLYHDEQTDNTVIVTHCTDKSQSLIMKEFTFEAFHAGRCFIAEETAQLPSAEHHAVDRGEVTVGDNGILAIRLSACPELVIRSARIGGRTVRLVQAAGTDQETDRPCNFATESKANRQPSRLVNARG